MCDQQSLRSACAYAQYDQSLCLSLEYSMIVKLLTEQHLQFLSLKGGCTGSSESTLVKMPHCWKLHVTAHIVLGENTRIVKDFFNFCRWEIFHAFLSSAYFFQHQLFEKIFQKYHLSVKQIGSRSGPTFCRA